MKPFCEGHMIVLNIPEMLVLFQGNITGLIIFCFKFFYYFLVGFFYSGIFISGASCTR